MNKSAIGDSVGRRAGKVNEGSYLEEDDHQKSQIESVQVCVRIRKLNAREEESLQPICVMKDSSSKGRLTIGHIGDNQVLGSDLKDFVFDTVIGPDESQDDVFEKVGKQTVTACLGGYNACVFAYGQTGAGKTYTMLGAGDQEQGLIQKMLHLVFARLKSKNQEYVIQCSFFEIYMEEIIDLMQPNKAKNIRVIEDFNGVRVDNLAQVQVTNHIQAVELIKKGQKSRHVASTRMNAESSRSHSIFSMTINVKDKDPSSGVLKERMAKLHFVDLAGSERQKQTQASGQRLKEAAQINQSLTTLGIVIHSLSEGHKKICYRNSKLTHLLKDSLGGNSKTLMIAAVSPSADSYGETLSTLKFAERVKFVKNVAQVNEKASESLDNLKREISALKTQLQNANMHQKVQQELIDNFHHKSLEIQPILPSLQNKEEIEEIELNKRELLLDLHLEEKIREQQIQQDILKERVQDFQVWMKQFLETSGFVDLISELKIRVGLNVENIGSVESARDSQMHQWSSLFQVSTDKLKDYISAMSEFTVLTNQIEKQKDNPRKMNSNSKMNLEIVNPGEGIHNSNINRSQQMDNGILQPSSVSQNQRINNQNIINDIEQNDHDNSIQQSIITIQEKDDLSQQDISSKEHQNQSYHDKSQGYSIIASNQGDCQHCTSWRNELSKWRRHVNLIENEYREMQEENMAASERNGEQIRTLQNEVDSLQMQNLTLQEQLEAEEQKVMVLREVQERKEEKKDNLFTTLQYKEKLVAELQLELKEERKQKIDMYKYFRIDLEQIGAAPFENMWRYVESLRNDCQNEKDNFEELILRNQQLIVQQQEMLSENNGKRSIATVDKNKLRDAGYLSEFIAQRDQQEGNKLWSDRAVLVVLTELIEEIIARDDEYVQIVKKNQEIQAATSEEIAYLRQVQADNVQTIQELNDQLQDSQIFYNLKTKNFQNKLQTIRKQNIQNYHLSHNMNNNHNNLFVLNQSFELCSNSCKNSQSEKIKNCNPRNNSQDNHNSNNKSYSNQSNNNKRNLTYCESTPSKHGGMQDNKNNTFQSDILHSERLKIADSLKMNLNPVFQAAASPCLNEKQHQILEGFNSAKTPFNDSALSNIIMRSESDTLSDRNTYKDMQTPSQDHRNKQQSMVFGSNQKVSSFQNFKQSKHSQPSSCQSSDVAILADIAGNNNNNNNQIGRNKLKDSKNSNLDIQKKMSISQVLAASTDEDKVEQSLEQYYLSKSISNKGNNINKNESYASQFGEVNRFSIDESQSFKQQSQVNSLKRFKSEQKFNEFWQNSQQKENNNHNIRLTVSEKKLDKQQLHQIQATKSNSFNIENALNVIEEIERAKEIKKIQKLRKSKQQSEEIQQQQSNQQEEKQQMTTSQLEKKNQLLHAMELIKEDDDDDDDDGDDESFNQYETKKENHLFTQFSSKTKEALNLSVKKKQCSEASKQLSELEKQ